MPRHVKSLRKRAFYVAAFFHNAVFTRYIKNALMEPFRHESVMSHGRQSLGKVLEIRKTACIMLFLHLHCAKEATAPDTEAASIAEAAGIAVESLVSVRPFDGPVSSTFLDHTSGVIIGGSAWSVFEEIPHYAAFRDLLQKARRRKLPMFGICFGAQALAHAFGGRVIRDAVRAEYGSIEVLRTETSDPLFLELPLRFHAQAWHHDRLVELPEGAHAAAWSANGVLQAFASQDALIRGVQFHPERTQETFHRLLESRAAPCAAHPIERIRASLVPTPHATSLLARFVRSLAP